MVTGTDLKWGGHHGRKLDDGVRSTMGRTTYSAIARSAMTQANKQHAKSSRDQAKVEPVVHGLRTLQLSSRHPGEIGSRVGSVSAYTDKGHVGTSPEDYKIGDIIRVPHVVPSLDPKSQLGDKHVGWTDNTGPVVGKLRPSIVVGIYQYCMVCIPIWTSQGRGMKDYEVKDSIWLREWHDASEVWKGATESQYLMVSPTYRSVKSAYINLTQAFAVHFKYPIGHMGSLTETSRRRLEELWLIVVKKGFLKLKRQEDYAHEAAKKMVLTGEFELMKREQQAILAGERPRVQTNSRSQSHRHHDSRQIGEPWRK